MFRSVTPCSSYFATKFVLSTLSIIANKNRKEAFLVALIYMFVQIKLNHLNQLAILGIALTRIFVFAISHSHSA